MGPPFASSRLPEPPSAPRRWVPIRSLNARHRGRILEHLLELSSSDRYLRFGHHIQDAQLHDYVARLNFERDELFGVFDRRLRLIAVAHLAFGPGPWERDSWAEFGVSVRTASRGRGLGANLFRHAMLRARNRGCGRLRIQALSRNAVMLKIAADAGALVQRWGPESEAWLQLPPQNRRSRVDALMEEQAAR